jgi:hypothetical protein
VEEEKRRLLALELEHARAVAGKPRPVLEERLHGAELRAAARCSSEPLREASTPEP